MGIDFSPMAHGPHNFRDGLEFVEDLKLWSDAYEKRTMVPDESNHKLANETTAILLNGIPLFLQPYALPCYKYKAKHSTNCTSSFRAGRKVVSSLMDERLRRAMMSVSLFFREEDRVQTHEMLTRNRYDDPPSAYPKVVTSILHFRALLLRYCLPPRPYFMRVRNVSEESESKTGRYYHAVYEQEPWYVQPTFWIRNSPTSWLRWALRRPYPDGKNYKPEGYAIFEVGPQKFERFGHEECNETKDRLINAGRGSCPFRLSVKS